MSLREEQSAFVRDVVKLLAHAISSGYDVTFGEALRTPEQQRFYVQAGRSQTMQSNHLRKCAIDLNFFRNGELTYDTPDLGAFWESLNPKNSWGGNWKSFKDKPHFERRP